VNEAARALELEVVNVIESPIQGAEGNVEFLAFYKK
jgi:predicted rRNA methylase YqxC with S4 and FtsJ domains